MFDLIFERYYDKGFCLGCEPIRIHKHFGDNKDFPYHFHMLFSLGWWFLEIRIGNDYKGDTLL
mgnify:CR=1 FL=1